MTTDGASAQPSMAAISAFLGAAEAGDVGQLEALAAQQPGLIDARGNHDLNALAIASESGHLAVVRWLVARGADRTHALLFAAEGGSLEVVKYLVETGSDPNGEPGEEPRSSPLICATCFDELHRDVARYLIERGATADIFSAVGLGDHARIRAIANATPGILNTAPSPLHGKPPFDFRPLHLAIARRRDAGTAMLLIDLGADCRAETAVGLTPLPMAVIAGCQEVADRLCRDLGPLTPLELLALGRYDATRAQLCPGGKLDLESVRRQKLLHATASAGLTDAVRFLVTELGVPPDLPGPDYFGDETAQTALVYAVMENHRAVAETLLQAGADPNADQGGNMLALHLAAMCGEVDMIRLLAGHGGDLDRRDDMNGGTPLQWARYNRQDEAARLLASLGRAAAG
jgi:ankyrin repeat protein